MDTFKEQQQLTDLYNCGHAPLGGLEGRPGRGPSSMMLPLVPRQPERSGYEILCLGAHRDDVDKREVEPDLVLTHYREDRHQDHRLVSE
jgi:hypothetical protein